MGLWNAAGLFFSKM